ncbi:MAG: ribosome small subunit-dependent GTPase A [Holdemanella sp.]|nr:ribosome small subunit-dependent GTPase A [Holdemanella sp.]
MINRLEGRIIKIISNQYTIETEDKEVIARPAGKLRLNQSPCVGDKVIFEQVEDNYRILKIAERSNKLLRPTVANVDQALIVTSAKDPDYSAHLLNRLIFLVSLSKVKPIIVLTKSDLLADTSEILSEMDLYKKAGYTVFISHPGSNDDELKEVINGKVSVLCGQSGAGKSSLLNRLDPAFQLQTQAISKALGRGKHTTRHCELHKIGNGLVADTPGFSSLDFTRLNTEDIDEIILDFKPYLGKCRFANCVHHNEPDCAIKNAVENGSINKSVYEDYIYILENRKR